MLAAAIDHAGIVHRDAVVRLHPHGLDQIERGDARRPGPAQDQLEVLPPPAGDVAGVDQPRRRNARRSVVFRLKDPDAGHAPHPRLTPDPTGPHSRSRSVPTADQASVEAGELDMNQVPSPDIQRVVADPVLGPQVLQIPQFSITQYDFNNFQDSKLKSYKTPGPTANKDFRIALTQAQDKKACIDATYARAGEPAHRFLLPGIPGYTPDINPYPSAHTSAKEHKTQHT